ncbi:MAG TPA: VanZ family protein [Xanthomonadales bacterium]
MALLVIELPSPTRNFGLFINALHAPAFAVLTLALLHWSLKFLPRAKAVALTASTGLLVGLLGELLQVWGPRDADFLDLANDGIGIATGICLAWVFAIRNKDARRTQFRSGILILLPLLTLTLAPAAWYGYAAIAQQLAMPKILSFDARWDSSLYKASAGSRLQLEKAPANWPISGTRVVKIIGTGGRYPGITIEPTANWENYETLTFYAASANNLEARLTISIYDADSNRLYADRFNYSFAISPDPQLVTIQLSDVKSAPQGRETNMRAIKELIIFTEYTTGHEEFFLDEFQLNR